MFGKNAPPTNHFDTLVSGKAEIVGDIHFSGGLHIDGRVFGNIIADDDSKAVLRISDKGVVEGEVSVPHVIVNGTIVGDVHSCEHLELAAKAAVKGNIFYNTVEMVMGAQVDGRLAHRYKSSKGSEKPKMPKQVTREKPRPSVAVAEGDKPQVAAAKPAAPATAAPVAAAPRPAVAPASAAPQSTTTDPLKK
ncbi:bactofilin family protein [Marinospirillum alkaliphilum]|uniref:Protein CcmA, bactofilin family n=1 Tax=Marinospirillum alkaliphilum DSM 21637 TaxID=1122209 RepID=A0A1K1WHB1_9GAMM|nr:polymer-forming cytoskeletal protein [Marinospirillum alkaliphilum]SFX36702.1 protein CcmA, bactofilin family [Marinospirillum alkaliphilum DSM 21637]